MKIELNKDTGKVGIRMKTVRNILKDRFPNEDPEFLFYSLLSEPVKLNLIQHLEDEIAFIYITKEIRFSVCPEKNLTVRLDSTSEMLSLPHRLQKKLKTCMTVLLSS